MKKLSIKEVSYMGIFVALIAIGAFIKVPVPLVPFTLQFFFTVMAGILLGPRLGAMSVAAYVLLGLIGLPIFAEGGGIAYVLKPTFGYLIGFIVGTYVTGIIVQKQKNHSFINISIAGFIGLMVVYLFGVIYFWMMSHFYLGTNIGLWPLFLYGFLLCVPGDIVLCLLAGSVGKRMQAHGMQLGE